MLNNLLDIIVVTYNNRKILENTLSPLSREITSLGMRIIVVDNHSLDGTADWIRRNHPEWHLIPLNENVGFAKGNNIALKFSKAKYILFLNPDVITNYLSIDAMVEFMENNDDVAILGPKLINRDGGLQFSCRHFPTPMTNLFELLRLDRKYPRSSIFGHYLMSNINHDQIIDVDYVCGAAMLVRTKVLEEIGQFDEEFFIYAEEAELCWRAQKRGYRVVYFPKAIMIHLGGESTRALKKEMYSEAIRSRWRFFIKTSGYHSALLYLLPTIGSSLLAGKQLCSKLWRS